MIMEKIEIMKINFNKLWKAFMVSAITFFFSFGVATRSIAQEMRLLDQTFTATEAERGFHYFSVDSTFSDNWIVPFNYHDGAFYVRFKILDYPSKEPFNLSMCIWSDVKGSWETWSETCFTALPISGRGVFTTVTEPPSKWWQLHPEKPVDFNRVRDFKRLGIVYWCANYKNLSDWVPEDGGCWPERNLFLPMKMRVTVVAVAKGYEFSGWQ